MVSESEPMENAAFKNRLKTLRLKMKQARIGVLLIPAQADVAYTTGFLGEDSWAVVSTGGVYLLTDGRYAEQAAGQCAGCRIICRKEALPEAAGRLLNRLARSRAAVEDSVSCADYQRLRRCVKAALRTVRPVVEGLRAVKTAAEIATIRSAVRLGCDSLSAAVASIRHGMSESELAAVLEYEIRGRGAVTSFETIVAFGSNASSPHHKSGTRKLRKNDFILIDFGVKYKGYCSDLTRCFIVGKPSSAAYYRKVYETVEQARRAAVAAVRPNVAAAEIDAAARAVFHACKLPSYDHGTGHGLGLKVHEKPVISATSKDTLREGMIFTIEPGVYMPGRLGIRIEDDILVTPSGARVLSGRCRREPSLAWPAPGRT